MDAEAAELLDDMGTLRRRTRRDRSGYWLPLLLFGVLILAAPLTYRVLEIPPGVSEITTREPGWNIGGLFYYSPLVLFDPRLLIGSQWAVSLYWLGTAVVGSLVTIFWYRWRARRVGVQLRIRPYVWWAFGALAMALVGVPVVTYWLLGLLYGSNATSVWLSIAAFVAGLAIAVLSAGRSPDTHRSVPRKIGIAAGMALALVAAGNISVLASTNGFAVLFVIAAGVAGLAWAERSLLCGVIAVLFFAATLVANLYDMENVLYRLVGYSTSEILMVFTNLLLPGAMLVVGGVVALVRGRSRGDD